MKQYLEHLKLPADACEELLALQAQNPNISDLQNILFDPEGDEEAFVAGIGMRAKEIGVHEYKLALYILLASCERLKDLYIAQNIPLDIFYDSIMDIKYKADECMAVHHMWGTFVVGWFCGFFRMARFALGRMQYDLFDYRENNDWPVYPCGDFTLKAGVPILNCHIPSAGTLTWELRLDSYKRAHDFVRNFPHPHPLLDKYKRDEPLAIICGSWILYPGQREFLDPQSNIIAFMNDFDIVSYTETDKFPDAWRVFTDKHELPPEQWPTDSSLQRGYRARMLDGGKTGTGFGVIVFDGDEIVNQV